MIGVKTGSNIHGLNELKETKETREVNNPEVYSNIKKT